MDVNPRLMKAKLSQSGIHCTLDWVTACMDWLQEEHQNLSQAQILLKLKEQWLITDIQTPGVMERSVFPPNLSECVKDVLPGQYTLQVQHGHDIGSPAYGQLQKLHKVNLENARVSVDDSQASQLGQAEYQATQGGKFTASWEPKPQRVMMLTISDGFQTVEAMEHQPIKLIPDVITPGLKVQLLGPLTVRRGIIMLCSNNFRVLGGEVEELQEEFNLVKILQQKIGQEDVGQKGNMFATQTNSAPNVNLNNRNTISVPSQAAAVTTHQRQQRQQPISKSQNVEMSSMEIDDDDDDMLLLAASQIDMSSGSRMLDNEETSDTRRSSSIKELPKSSSATANKSAPIGVVQPLRPIQSSNKSNSPQKVSKNNTAQTSITSYMTQKISNAENNIPNDNETIPSFALLDSDDEFLSELPLSPVSQFVSNKPFQYLLDFKNKILKEPDKCLQGKFKVVSSTLASKMCLKKTVAGPQWQVAIMLNDGSDSLRADISPELLDKEIGSASKYVTLDSSKSDIKAAYKERMKKFSMKLADLSCLVSIKFEGSESNPTIVDMEDVDGLHVDLLMERKLY